MEFLVLTGSIQPPAPIPIFQISIPPFFKRVTFPHPCFCQLFSRGALPMTTTCLYCGARFTPQQRANQHHRAGAAPVEALYCSPAHRQAAYRRRKNIAAGIPASARRTHSGKVRLTPRTPLSATVTERSKPPGCTDVATAVTQPEIPQQIQEPARAFSGALLPIPPRVSKPLPAGIVRDAKYPSMYRLVLPDGTLSDLLNLTRAKDALATARIGQNQSD